MREHGYELIPGLPERLPEGETILWQGRPAWFPFARRVFLLRGLAIYFGLLLAWQAATGVLEGLGAGAIVLGAAPLMLTACCCLLGLGFIGWLSARMSIYTVTDRRVVMQVGIALPTTINLPFAVIDSMAARRHRDGTEDVLLTIARPHRVSLVALWPHCRPFRLARPEPLLRGLRQQEGVSRILARALAASAEQPVQPVAAAPPDLRVGAEALA
ncbi:MAG: photosynthetic complex putative assembly protein PuhB [Acetobacteraceae bacterium]|nr:photosynthetic complex putative assembly protein PuhB [Acetobacteraceae bacterium]MDW8399620.1 photosynthetic complex putative assembly protein PuhB [Acetobacteraceae bacterium]